MEEYIHYKLADGEDNKKSIQHSESRAGRKLKSSKGARGKKMPMKRVHKTQMTLQESAYDGKVAHWR